MYLVQLLVRDLAGFISGWTYVTTASYVFPNHTTEGVTTFYIPDNEPDFPGLEQVECSILHLRDYSAPAQVYWSVLEQFSPSTEPFLRAGKSELWCWYVGRAVYDHCFHRKSQNQCSGTGVFIQEDIIIFSPPHHGYVGSPSLFTYIHHILTH